ncbi:hypothetical protein M2271_001662 [Streptomyces sp. LBL]|uniref:hypothetical protein n=1 Tax=Streptomyces sp. LBL TaxID=2940562 RepID=UPI00247EEF1A|nr:hypothetical protein [Streptomyces sp. LBL]
MATVTVSDLDRLHSRLSRFEDMFPGCRMEIVAGTIMTSPVKPHHAKTIRLVWNDLAAQSIPTAHLPVDPDAPHRS